jgi:hypothetical protein
MGALGELEFWGDEGLGWGLVVGFGGD